MKEFLLAIQFLTIIPIRLKNVTAKKIADSLICFPFVGLLMGLVLAWVNRALTSFPAQVTSVVLVVLLIIMTGGLHLDGLSDTFDAIASGKTKEEMLKIMRDPHAGVMGILSLTCAILLKIFFLANLNNQTRSLALILMVVLSRWSLVPAIFLYPYARQEGKAKLFKEGINGKILIMATVLGILIAFSVWQDKGLLLLAIAGLTAVLFAKAMTRILGGITGDILGAASEIVEIGTLFLVVILTKTN